MPAQIVSPGSSNVSSANVFVILSL